MLVPLVFSAQAICAASPDRDASALLRADSFAPLEERYSALQHQFDEGSLSGDELRNAFRAFYPTDRDLAVHFDRWVRAYPGSYVARLARGIYYKKRGYEERGEKYMSETSQPQIDKMDDAMSKATRDLGASIQMDPKPFLSYFNLLDMGRQYISVEQSRKIYDKAAELDANSGGLHIKFMLTLEPKWGGSLNAMRSFLKESQDAKLSVVDRHSIETMVLAEEGVEQRSAGDLTTAEASFRKAVALGGCDCTTARNELNKILFEEGRYSDAIVLLDQYLHETPDDQWALDNRGLAEWMTGRPREAVRDWAAPADGGDSWAQSKLGLAYLNGFPDVMPPDYALSVHWLRLAAAQGEQEALENLQRAESLAAKRLH